jgi:hypothetical protein
LEFEGTLLLDQHGFLLVQLRLPALQFAQPLRTFVLESGLVSLPSVGYLTRLDKFMIATYLVFLTNIAFSVAMVRLATERLDRRHDRLGHIISALLAAACIFIAANRLGAF